MAGIARWCFRGRIVVLLLWLAGLVGAGIASGVVGNGYSDTFALPRTESTKALRLL